MNQELKVCFGKRRRPPSYSMSPTVASVAARKRQCKGAQCGRILAIDMFSTNYSTSDGYNLYCIDCNNSHRRAQYRKHGASSNSGGADEVSVVDDFEQFKLFYQKGEILQQFLRGSWANEDEDRNPLFEQQNCENAKRAVAVALEETWKCIKVEPEQVYSEIFEKERFVCSVSGKTLHPSCFASHAHRIAINRDSREIYVSGCFLQQARCEKFEEARELLRTVLKNEKIPRLS